jgi:hypothetical protein
MEVIREFIDGTRLTTVIPLPEHFKNHKLEVIIMPAEETAKSKPNADRIDKALHALAGAVPYTDMTLSELREERLQKYEITD